MSTLAGKVGLVTGGGRGLGRACCQLFAREGGRVVVVDLDETTGAETVGLIEAAGGEAVFVRADVSDSGQVQAMVQAALDTYGQLDCAINNAVRFIPQVPLADVSDEDFLQTMAVNYNGVFRCMKYEIKAMVEAGGGAIVNIGSARENSAKAGVGWYLSAKQGVYAMTRCAAVEYGSAGLRINAVAPGPMWTPALRQTADANPGHVERHVAHVPLGRIGDPEEVAEAAVWLLSSRASYVHGVVLSADGGYVHG